MSGRDHVMWDTLMCRVWNCFAFICRQQWYHFKLIWCVSFTVFWCSSSRCVLVVDFFVTLFKCNTICSFHFCIYINTADVGGKSSINFHASEQQFYDSSVWYKHTQTWKQHLDEHPTDSNDSKTWFPLMSESHKREKVLYLKWLHFPSLLCFHSPTIVIHPNLKSWSFVWRESYCSVVYLCQPRT